MKKIVLLLLLCTGITQAQDVNIPDANFKNALLGASTENGIAYSNGLKVKVDQNADGEIQEIEAQAIDSLDVGPDIFFIPFEIANLTGVESFVNLKSLNCSGNLLTNLDVSSLPLLQKLVASDNQITAINISGLTALTDLEFVNNQITSIDLSTNMNLINLNLLNNILSTIDLTGLVNLKKLNVGYNQLSSINLTNVTGLEELDVDDNNLTNLDLSGFNSLKLLNCARNNIPAIDFSNLVSLEFLSYGGSGLDSLDVSNLVNLRTLYCENNNLTVLDISNLANLTTLDCRLNSISSLNFSASSLFNAIYCNDNLLTSIDVSNQLNLRILHINNNLLTSLDLSNNEDLFELFGERNLFTNLDFNQNPSLFFLDISENTNLETLFFKNDAVLTQPSIPAVLSLGACPNLRYVCVNEELIQYVQSEVDINSGATNVVVNSYCSFSPSGDYNSISGTIKFDFNGNGCDASDEVIPNLRVNINDGTFQGASFINAAGAYQFFTQEGNYTVAPSIENPSWFNFAPATATINFTNNNNNIATQDFCLTAIGIRRDVTVVVAPVFFAVPGADATYQVVVTNKGNQTLSGSVGLGFNDNLMNFVAASVTPAINEIGTIGWNYINLQPFESRNFDVVFAINAATDTPAVNIGDQLSFTAQVLPVVDDETPADNEFQFTQTVVDTAIVNDIYCLEGDVVDPSYIGEYLHYMINFENVGTLSAQNIVIRFDVDPSNFDINTLQLLNSSNPVYTRIVGNVVEFIFQNINLEIGGHGNILLKLRTNGTLVPADVVSNGANIFFGFNAPVNTGVTETRFQTLSNVGFQNGNIVSIYPNPTTSTINIKSDYTIQSIEIYDVQGRVLQTQVTNEKQTTIDLAQKAKGIYFIKINTEKGMQVQKLQKD
jgi:Leucine-rich repeat (LRR) protein